MEIVLREESLTLGNVGNENSSLIENVLLVDGLKHNLLTISQLCNKGFKIIFEPFIVSLMLEKLG